MRRRDSASNQSFSGSTAAGAVFAGGGATGAGAAAVLAVELTCEVSTAGRGRGSGGDTKMPECESVCAGGNGRSGGAAISASLGIMTGASNSIGS